MLCWSFLAHDLPATEGLVLAAAQPPIRASALLDRVTEAAWHTKPSWYAVTVEEPHDLSRFAALDCQQNQCERLCPTRRSCAVSVEAEGDGGRDPHSGGFCVEKG